MFIPKKSRDTNTYISGVFTCAQSDVTANSDDVIANIDDVIANNSNDIITRDDDVITADVMRERNGRLGIILTVQELL